MPAAAKSSPPTETRSAMNNQRITAEGQNTRWGMNQSLMHSSEIRLREFSKGRHFPPASAPNSHSR